MMTLIYVLMLLALGWVIYLWVDDYLKSRQEEAHIRAQNYYAQFGQGAISLHFIRPRRRSFRTIITELVRDISC